MILNKIFAATLLIAMMAGVVIADPFGINQNQINHLTAEIAETVYDASTH